MVPGNDPLKQPGGPDSKDSLHGSLTEHPARTHGLKLNSKAPLTGFASSWELQRVQAAGCLPDLGGRGSEPNSRFLPEGLDGAGAPIRRFRVSIRSKGVQFPRAPNIPPPPSCVLVI